MTKEKPLNSGKMEDRDKKGRFIKGRSKTGGKKLGSFSIKSQIIKRLKKDPQELKKIIEYFIKENRELMWQMLEGRPPQHVDVGSTEGLKELTDFFRKIAKPKQDDKREPKSI